MDDETPNYITHHIIKPDLLPKGSLRHRFAVAVVAAVLAAGASTAMSAFDTSNTTRTPASHAVLK